jgi:hypothetical protein
LDPNTESYAADIEDCPRWYIKVRYPASEIDRRAVLENPAAFFAKPVPVSSVEMRFDPKDPEAQLAFERLDASMKTARCELLTIHLGSSLLRLNRTMQAELHAGLLALLVGATCECPVETEPSATVQ